MAMPMIANKAANEAISSAERRWLAEMASHIKALMGRREIERANAAKEMIPIG
jgi:hypothetical protein